MWHLHNLKFAFTISKAQGSFQQCSEDEQGTSARTPQMQRAGTDSRDNLQQILPLCSSSQKTGVFDSYPLSDVQSD
jgi:hypothetical protein